MRTVLLRTVSEPGLSVRVKHKKAKLATSLEETLRGKAHQSVQHGHRHNAEHSTNKIICVTVARRIADEDRMASTSCS